MMHAILSVVLSMRKIVPALNRGSAREQDFVLTGLSVFTDLVHTDARESEWFLKSISQA